MSGKLLRTDNLLDSLSDHFTPLLIRETRQGLRGNSFAYSVVVASSLLSLALICGVLNQSFDESAEGMKTGLYVFNFCYFLLWFICCLVVPFSAASKVRDEVGGGEYELISVTGISPSMLLLGKLQACFVQTIMLCVLAAPFLMSCVLLRGVSTPEIILRLGVMALFSLCLTQLGVLLGSLKLTKPMHSLMALAFVGGLFGLMVFSLASTGRSGDRLFSSEDGNYKIQVIFGVCAPIIYGVLGFLAALATLNIQKHDRAMPLKIAMFILAVGFPWLVSWLFKKEGQSQLNFVVAFIVAPLILASLLLPMTSLRQPSNRRLGLPKPLEIAVKFLFGQGIGSTMVWFSLSMFGLFAWESSLGYADKSNHILSLLLVSFSFWAFAGNILALVFRRAHPFTLSVAGIVIPSVAAAVMSFTPLSDLAKAVFPLTLPFYLLDNDMTDNFIRYELLWLAFMFVAGGLCHILQIMKAKAVKS